jgi:hypothetical protein
MKLLKCPKCNKILSNQYISNIDIHYKVDNEKRTLTFNCLCKYSITIPICPFYSDETCIHPLGCVIQHSGFCVANTYETDDKYKDISKEDIKTYYKHLLGCFKQEEYNLININEVNK